MMEGTLTEFGQTCRKLRAAKGFTMADQSLALECDPSTISSIEAGNRQPTIDYISRFASWVKADIFEHQTLIKKGSSSPKIIDLNDVRKKAQKRFYRKLNKLTPSQIRALRDGGREKPDD